MKRVFIAFVLVGLVGAALVVSLIRGLDREALGAQAVAEIRQRCGLPIEAQEVALHPWAGLELVDVSAEGPVEAGTVEVRLQRLTMKHRLLPLLKGELVFHRVELHQLRVDLLTRSSDEIAQQRARRRRQKRQREARDEPTRPSPGSGAVEASSGPADGGGSLRFSIEELMIENAALSLRSGDRAEPDFELEGLNLLLLNLTVDPEATSLGTGLSASGRFDTGKIVHGDLQAVESAGRIRLLGSRIRLTEIDVHATNADLLVRELEIHAFEEPLRYRLQAAGRLDLNGILNIDDPPGFGPVAIEFAGDGDGPELRDLVGAGQVTLNAGAIPGFASMIEIEDLVGRRLLTGRRYERTEIDYRLADSWVELLPFEVAGDGATFGAQGQIELTGSLALEAFLRVPWDELDSSRSSAERLPVETDESGSVRLPFEITGTVEEPTFRLTGRGLEALAGEAARSWAEEALDELKERAEEWLKSRSQARDDPDDG